MDYLLTYKSRFLSAPPIYPKVLAAYSWTSGRFRSLFWLLCNLNKGQQVAQDSLASRARRSTYRHVSCSLVSESNLGSWYVMEKKAQMGLQTCVPSSCLPSRAEILIKPA